MADALTLREAVFSVLKNEAVYDTLPFASLRKKLENDIGLPHKSLKHQKAEIMDLIVEFKKLQKEQQRVTESHKPSDSGFKTGKYSKNETDIIMTAVQDYLASNDLGPGDVCPALRESGKQRRNIPLWNMLRDLLPHRQVQDIKAHTILKLAAALKHGPWEDEEKKQLLNMVEAHGTKWSMIGKLLNRYPGDCKDAYKILQPRAVSGKYSQQEQLRLVAAIRKACECAEDTPKENLPSQGISWVTVARLMNNERLPLDYQRKWVTLRTVDIGDAETATREDAGLELSDRASSGDHSDRQILSFLADLEPEDESEVTWSIIDRELTLRRGYARMRWLQMCNQAMFGPQHDMEFRLKRLLDMKGVSGQDFNAIHRMKTVARPSENPVHDGNQSADSTIPLPVLATSPESDTVGLCQVEVAEYTMREDEHQNDDGSDILSTSMISPIENQLGAEEKSKKKHRKKHSRDHNVESGGGIQHEEKKHKKKRKYLEETDEKEDNSSKKNKKRKHKNRSE